MVLLLRQGLPTPRPMPSRQVVLLTPLESSHPQQSPSRHRINRVNRDFPVVDPLCFQMLTGVHFATHLFSCSSRNGGGYTPLPPFSPGIESAESLPRDPRNSFSCNIYKAPRANVANKRLTQKAKPCRCNTYKKTGGGGYETVNRRLATLRGPA